MLKQLAQWMIWQQEKGQMTVEYLLLVSMLVGVVIAAFNLYTGPLGEIFETIDSVFNTLRGDIAF